MSYVSRLRSVLGPDAVLQSGGGYRLVVDELDIDGRRVEYLLDRSSASPPTEAITLLDEALGCIAGPAFGEFAHEWWALAEAARLEELGLVARERRAEQLVAVGRCEDAFMSLDGVVTAHPLRASAVVASFGRLHARSRGGGPCATSQSFVVELLIRQGWTCHG